MHQQHLGTFVRAATPPWINSFIAVGTIGLEVIHLADSVAHHFAVVSSSRKAGHWRRANAATACTSNKSNLSPYTKAAPKGGQAAWPRRALGSAQIGRLPVTLQKGPRTMAK
jgi:hypothetical protein